MLLQSIMFAAVFILSMSAKAAPVDRALVTYFNTLYKTKSPNCTVDEPTKTRILAELEPRCLVRTTVNGEPFISGVKSACSEASVKSSVDAQVNSLCSNKAYEHDKANQSSAAKKAAQSGQGGVGGIANQVAAAYKTYEQIIKAGGKAEGIYNKGSEQVDKAKDYLSKNSKDLPATANNNTHPAPAGASQVTDPNVTTTSLNSNVPAEGDTTSAGAGEVASNSEITKAQSEANKDIASLPKESREAAKEVASPDVQTGTDPELEQRHKLSKAEDQELTTLIEALKKQITTANQQIGTEATTNCSENATTASQQNGYQTENPKMKSECDASAPQTVINCIDQQVQQLEKDRAELQKDKEACSNHSAQADKACSMVRSDKAQKVQKFMVIGTAILSNVTAASESCRTTSTISKIAQAGVLTAQGFCGGLKLRCDLSCNSAKKTLETMKTKVQAMKACQPSTQVPNSAPTAASQLENSIAELEKKLNEELTPEKSVPTAIAQCQKHKLDIATMGMAAAGFLSAFKDAEKCKEQLSVAGTSTAGAANSLMSTADYCSIPSNASTITCKCTENPNAEGCLGSIATSGVAFKKTNNGSGASAFASAKQNGLGALDPLAATSGTPAAGVGLSAAAREALGLNGNSGGDGTSGSGSSGRSRYGSASDKNSEVAGAKKDDKGKFGFFSSLSSMLSGGGKKSDSSKAANRNYEQDQAIKRKLASEKVRAEITTASGKSNFDKIKSCYQSNMSSLLEQ